MITDSFFVENGGGTVCKSVLNLYCQDSIHSGIFQVAYKFSLFHFLQNSLRETLDVCLKT